MVNRKRLFTTTLSIASVLTLAACGGSGDAATDSGGASADGTKTLTFMFRGGED